MDTHVAAHELRLSRRLLAPPEEVFAAWTDPARIPAWWGPQGWTTPEAAVELRPGGRHVTRMRGPAGEEERCACVIEEVAAPSRLVLRVADGPLGGTVAHVAIVPEAGGARLDVTWRHPSAAMRAAHESIGFHKGWGEALDRLSAHVAPVAGCPMGEMRAGAEHGWLHRLLGEWQYESSCAGPDGTELRATGRESVRALGPFWVVGEAEGEMPGGAAGRWIMTLGYDPSLGRFRGSWAGSMIPFLFVYDGALSEDGRTLTLDNEGPSMTGAGRARYRDALTLTGTGERLLVSSVEEPDGSWREMMRLRAWRA